jgi:hypothetical protein
MFLCGEIEQLGDIFFHKMNEKENIVILRDLSHPFLKKKKINHI